MFEIIIAVGGNVDPAAAGNAEELAPESPRNEGNEGNEGNEKEMRRKAGAFPTCNSVAQARA